MNLKKAFELNPIDFKKMVSSESAAFALLWRLKCAGEEFRCLKCGNPDFWAYKDLEIRKCQRCSRQHRLRAGTVFKNTKVRPHLILRTVNLLASRSDKISTRLLMKMLKLNSRSTAQGLLRRAGLLYKQIETPSE